MTPCSNWGGKVALTMLIAMLLVACASRAPRPERAAGIPAPLEHTKVEIVYNAQPELLVVGGSQLPMLTLSVARGRTNVSLAAAIDLESRDKADVTAVERARQFQAAAESSLNQRPLQLHQAFVEQIAAQLRATGREVKLTPAVRAFGMPRDMEISGYAPAPGYATVLLRIITPYEASDVLSPFHPVTQISYRIRDASQGPIAADSIVYRRGGPAYFSFDALLKDARKAYGGLEQQLSDSVSTITGYFPEREDAQ